MVIGFDIECDVMLSDEEYANPDKQRGGRKVIRELQFMAL